MHKIGNLTMANEVIALVPTGKYQILTICQDQEDSNIFSVNVTFTVK